MHIDGAVNMRDIGGWMTESGVRIPQGLLFRGSELDGAVEPSYRLTEDGLREMITKLGIRYDLDLRSADINPSKINALGANVKHEYFNAPMYADAFSDENRETMRSIFSAIAKPENYPMYLHCTYGRDRTGTVCYILEALLGVSEGDLRRDYEMSAFTDSYAELENFAKLTYALEQCAGDSLSQKAESYLKGLGVTDAEIASIKQIFLGSAE
jgi:protein-tyrosine phosphatase